MPLITWQDGYSVGVPQIDDDHKLLVSLINQLDDAIRGGQGHDVVGSVLTVLEEYTHGHFGREELLMAKAGYSDLPAHHREHEKLTAQVRDIAGRYHRGDRAALDGAVLEFLKTWLTGHILGVDMKYAPYLDGVALTPEELLASIGLADAGDGEDDDPWGS
jgi:hemerythrin